MATWICFRSPPDEAGIHVSVQKIKEIAEQVGGVNNGLKYVQVPLNLLMIEAMSEKWQPVDSELYYQDRKKVLEEQNAGFLKKMMLKKSKNPFEFEVLLRVLRIYKLNMMASSPFMQG